MVPDSIEHEIKRLREENAQLRKELNDMSELYGMRFCEVNKRLKQLEGGRRVESGKVFAHIDVLYKWLIDHEDTRKGLTYNEAARILNVSRVRVCQMKEAIDKDGRIKVVKEKRKTRIILA